MRSCVKPGVKDEMASRLNGAGELVICCAGVGPHHHHHHRTLERPRRTHRDPGPTPRRDAGAWDHALQLAEVALCRTWLICPPRP